MTPLLATNDIADLCLVDAESICNGVLGLAGCAPTSDFNIGGLELGVSSVLPLPVREASLGCAVGDVVLLCSQEEVLWVDARGVIAAMQNVHPWRDGANENVVRPPMRFPHLAGTGRGIDAKAPITLSVLVDSVVGTGPFPAARLSQPRTSNERVSIPNDLLGHEMTIARHSSVVVS